MGGVVKSVAGAGAGIAQGALGPLTSGTLGDTLFGKEDPGQAASVVNVNSPEAQKFTTQAMNKFGEYLNKDPNQIAENQTVLQENQARQNALDQEMQAKQAVAQRGLGNTSLGLNAVLNSKQDLNKQIGAIRANQPMLANQLGQQNLNFAAGGIGNLMGAQNQGIIYNKAVASQGRLPGGIAPILMKGGQMAMTGMG